MADVLAGGSRVLVLRGDAGAGKSALLGHLRERVAGWTVISARGVESETELTHSGLHQICTPLLSHLTALPVPQREALAIVLGLETGPAPDRFLVAVATLTLIAEASAHRPLACAVDDVQWLDRASVQTLAFVARRLKAERVALVCAVRTGSGDGVLAGLPTLPVRGLTAIDARRLLLDALHGPLDPAVCDRIAAESRGNPLAVLELTHGWTAAELAGGFGLPHGRALAAGAGQSHLQRLALLPPDTRLLVVTAAAEPLGDPAVLRRAAHSLGVPMTAAAPAMDAGLLEVAGRVQFAHPLTRSAVYHAAAAEDRRRAHHALAEATDGEVDPDRRAWHHAGACWGPDEVVAVALERSAGHAQARGGIAATAAFLTRAAELTPDPATRVRRALDAAITNLQAGAPDTTFGLLTVAGEGPTDDLQRARVDLVRGRLALASRRGNEAAPLLLAAARQLEPMDPELAQEAYIDALSAAHSAGRLREGVAVVESARAAQHAARRSDVESTTIDLVLGAFGALTDDHTAAAALGRSALARMRGDTGNHSRLLWPGTLLALELWDDESAHLLSDRHLRIVRDAGALGDLPLALNHTIHVLVLCGGLRTAAGLVEEARFLGEAAEITASAHGALSYSAWRGEEVTARKLLEAEVRDARARGEGIGVAIGEYARAVLCNGLGQYDEAFAAARRACADPQELAVHNWGLTELVEAASRTGRTDLAKDALQRLDTKARASGTEWALGMAARARALLSEGHDAEGAFQAAIEHLTRTRVRAEHARARLLYGEWLRQADRRVEARHELTIAHDMLTDMGLEGFAERARRELLATGATVRTHVTDVRDDLTAQEAHIARLARDGLSNPDIGAQLVVSTRTVEYHLRKVFTKLGIKSRKELRRALPDRDRPRTTPWADA